MALRQPLMYKTVVGDTQLELEPDPGESYLVKRIYIDEPDTGATAKIITDRRTVGYFECGLTLGNHLAITKHNQEYQNDYSASADRYRVEQKTANPNILDTLMDDGLFQGFPVANGEKLVIDVPRTADTVQVVEYEEYDEADILSTMPNGSKATELTYLCYGKLGSDPALAGAHEYTVADIPNEFTKFPFEQEVASNTKMIVHGIIGTSIHKRAASANDKIYTEYLRMTHEREVLFDDDRNGIPNNSADHASLASGNLYGQGVGPLHANSDRDPGHYFRFPTPLEFMAGDELTVETILGAGGTVPTLLAADCKVCFVLTEVRA